MPCANISALQALIQCLQNSSLHPLKALLSEPMNLLGSPSAISATARALIPLRSTWLPTTSLSFMTVSWLPSHHEYIGQQSLLFRPPCLIPMSLLLWQFMCTTLPAHPPALSSQCSTRDVAHVLDLNQLHSVGAISLLSFRQLLSFSFSLISRLAMSLGCL